MLHHKGIKQENKDICLIYITIVLSNNIYPYILYDINILFVMLIHY